MCRRVTCSNCGKPSFAGCGLHVEQVLAGVPRDERCRCYEAPQARSSAARSPSAESEATKASLPEGGKAKSWLWPF